MKCKSKVDGGYFRLNEKGKWVKVNAPIQEEFDFQFPIPPVHEGKSCSSEEHEALWNEIKGGNMKKLVLINGNAVQGETIKFSLDSGFYTVENATYQGVEYACLEIPVSSVLFYAREKE